MAAKVFCFKASWPPASLSPNGGHRHWAVKNRAKRLYAELIWADVMDALGGSVDKVPHFGKAVIDLEFVAPDKRSRDLDNCISRFKAGQDVLGLGNTDRRGNIVRPGLGIVDSDDSNHIEYGAVKVRPRLRTEEAHVLVTIRQKLDE